MTLMYQIRNRIPIKQCIVFHHIYFYCHVFDLPASCIHFNKRNHTVNMTRKLRKLTKKEIVNLSNRAMDYYRKKVTSTQIVPPFIKFNLPNDLTRFIILFGI